MIGTRILKIDLEIAEIFEVKVGTRHLEINILLLPVAASPLNPRDIQLVVHLFCY